MKIPMRKRLLALAAALCMALCMMPAVSADTPTQYLALGDSITTGYKDETSTVDKPFADQIAEENGLALTNLAAVGETTTSLLARLYNPTPELGFAVLNADVITLTIGGNDMMDALYGYVYTEYNKLYPDQMTQEEVKEFIIDGDPELLKFAADVLDGFMTSPEALAAVNTFRTNFQTIITGLKDANPDVQIVVATQYNPYTYLKASVHAAGDNFATVPQVAQALAMVDTVYASFEQALGLLNGDLKTAAEVSGYYTVADVYTAFASSGADLCNASYTLNPMTFAIKFNLDFHPNQAGHDLIAKTFSDVLYPTRAAVTPASADFGSLSEGYTAPDPVEFTITNAGVNELQNVTVELSSNDFVLDAASVGATIAAGGTALFTVAPKADLAAGTYEAAVTVKADGIDPITRTVSFEVTSELFALTVENGTGGGSYAENDVVEITANAPESGMRFAGWTCDDESVVIANKGAETTTVTMPAKAVTVKANYEAIVYTILEGDKGVAESGSDDTLTVRASGAYALFDHLEVDGKTVDAKNYTVKEGSTVVTLNADYLATLAVGEHTMTFVYKDGGKATATFTVKAASASSSSSSSSSSTTPPASSSAATTVTSTPQTGDSSNIAAWFAVLAVSGLALAGAALYIRKRREE